MPLLLVIMRWHQHLDALISELQPHTISIYHLGTPQLSVEEATGGTFHEGFNGLLSNPPRAS